MLVWGKMRCGECLCSLLQVYPVLPSLFRASPVEPRAIMPRG